MKFLFIVLFWALCGRGTAKEWFEVFQDKLKAGVYTETQTRARWTKWIDDGHLIMNCTDELENRREQHHPLTEIKIVDGFMLDQRRCDFIFPASSEKTVKDNLELLSGFSNAGFFKRHKGDCSVTYKVTMMFRRELQYSFFIQRDFAGQVLFTSHKTELLSYDEILPQIDKQVRKEVKAEGSDVSEHMHSNFMKNNNVFPIFVHVCECFFQVKNPKVWNAIYKQILNDIEILWQVTKTEEINGWMTSSRSDIFVHAMQYITILGVSE
jgi:hypothetical protein